MKFIDWQRLKELKKRSVDWLDNANRKDSQSGNRYTKRVVLGKDAIEFCGQAYAGATNYHSMPENFRPYVQKSILANFDFIMKEALKMLNEEEKAASIQAKAEVEKLLDEIKENEVKEDNYL